MSNRTAFRQDIQALRGVAVLLVLLFHAKIGGLSAGYLGVDIFFVLSGFLITGLVHRRLQEGRFSFLDFYLNRAKRLLPASYVVYAFTAIAAYWLLTDSEFERFLNTLWGALTFTANIVLWTGTDYFSSGAKFNPLLHVWSLSIEEQFYFLMPLALFLTPARYRLALVAVGGIASLALCFYFVSRSPVAAFYMLPTRAWELALGSVLALAAARQTLSGNGPRALSQRGHALGLLAVAGLLLVPVMAPGAMLGLRHPSLDAILVCAATGALLVLRLPLLDRGPLSWGLARLGDVSYSLYLIHWPLFAFATNAYVGETAPIEVRMALLAISVVLAFLLFQFVEEPIRRRNYTAAKVRLAFSALTATVMVAILAGGISHVRMLETTDVPQRTANFGLHETCEFEARFEPRPECIYGPAPDTLLWGDSFAMHLAPGLATQNSGGLLQATKSLCGPFLDMAPAYPTIPYARDWSVGCILFNDSVFAFLSKHPEIKRVVLSSPYSQYVKSNATALIKTEPGGYEKRVNERPDVIDEFRRTVERIEALGKDVVIVGPTPATGFDIGLCHERKAIGAALFGPNRDCQLSAVSAREFRADVYSMLNEVTAATGARLVDLTRYLCDDFVCRTEIDEVPLYWDAGHFSADGSRKVMADSGVGDAILGDTSSQMHRGGTPEIAKLGQGDE